MQSSKKRIRKDYAPLIVSAELVCTTPSSPATQVYNPANAQFEPDRALSPTIIFPEIRAMANDGSWSNPYVNPLLTDIKWYVNNEEIATADGWAGLYAITTSGENCGALSISRNVFPGQLFSLRFEASLADTRLGVVVPIVTDELLLSTADKSEDEYTLSLADSATIKYDPIRDLLAEYEYKVAQGIIEGSEALRAAAIDINAWEREIPLLVTRGESVITEGYTIKLYRVTSADTFVELTPGAANEVIAVNTSSIKLDLRLVTKNDYLVRLYVPDATEALKLMDAVQFSVARVYRKYTCRPTNGTAIHPTDLQRYDKAMVACEGNVVPYPEVVFRIVWKTDSYNLEGKTHNEGQTTIFTLSDTGIGNTWADDWLDVYCESEHKAAHNLAVDSTGNNFVDSEGNNFIFH
jgi:hypothetical protein